MNNFSFSVAQNIISGAGSINQIPEQMKKLNCSKALIISGPNVKKTGVVKQISDIIENAGLDCVDFCDTSDGPCVEVCEKGAKTYKDFGADGIIALGGGSPMDIAKAVGVLANLGGSVTDYEGAEKFSGDIPPLIAIPTTAGTGSEVTAFSVISDHSRNYKLTIFSYKLVPKCAILDPNLILSLPASIAAATGMDALVHAIEAYLSKAASPFSDAMAEKGMELIGKSIRSFVADRSNISAAEDMLVGSMFAGIAFTWARLGNVHAMSHPLEAYFKIPHGKANAILLPTILDYNALADDGRYRKIYNYISLQKTHRFDCTMLSDEIRKLNSALDIPKNLTDAGVTEDKISIMAVDAMKSGNVLVNPRSTTIDDIESLYYTAMN